MKAAQDLLHESQNPDLIKKEKEQLKRARITALILATTTVVSLVFLVFAFSQKSEADKLRAEVNALKMELDNCRTSK